MATFEEWLATNYPDEKTVAKEKLLSTIDVNPQAATSSIKLAREEGVPIAFAPSEPDPNQQLQLSLRKSAQAIDSNPEFAKWLSSQPPVVAGAISDDILNLSKLSQVAQEFNNVLGAVASSAPAFNAGAWGLVRAAGDALPDVLGEPVVGLAQRYQKEQQKYVRDLMPQGDGALPDAVYSGLQSAGLSLMTLPLGLVGGGAAMLAPGLIQVLGDSYSQARETGLSGPAAMSHAIEMAGFEYITERIPAGRLIEDLLQGSGLGQTLIRQLAAEVPGEQLATLTQDLTEWANLNPDKSFGEFVRERPEAALNTLIATATGAGTTVLTAKGVEKIASKLLREDSKLREATETASALQKLATLSQVSETAKRDVETFEGFLQTAFQGFPAENVYIDANVLMQFGLAQQLAERSPTVAQQLPEAAAGTMVKIPVSEVMGRFNQDLVPLLAELRPTPEGLTQREAEAFMAEQGPELEAEIERILTREAKDTAIAEQKTAIAEEVAKAIVSTGRARPEVAKQYGQLVAAFYATMAERSGMSAKDLWEQRKVSIVFESLQKEAPKGFTRLLQIVYHGTPHRFPATEANPLGEFDASKIGTGEGAQAQGHGIYLAESPDVARAYQNTLSKYGELRFPDGTTKNVQDLPYGSAEQIAGTIWMRNPNIADAKFALSNLDAKHLGVPKEEVIKQLDGLHKANASLSGHFYTADLPDEMIDKMLDWDKPLSKDAPQAVKDAFNRLAQTYPDLKEKLFAAYREGKPGSHYYSLLNDYAKTGDLVKNQIFASDAMRQAGIPGIKYLDQGSRDKGKGTRNFVVFPGEEKKIKIIQRNNELLQAENDVVRGSFSPEEMTIRLGQASDLSTFLHESGHLFFHLMNDLASLPNASESMQKDADALLKWLGIEATPERSRRDVWFSMSMEEQRQYHETMARGFEVYLSEGKAPSVKLQSAFAKFRSWLLNVYKALLRAAKGRMGEALQVRLNPEVRAILDRMLATEEEIEAAEAANAMGGMFKTPEEAAQLRIDWERYQALGQAATDQAVSELGARSIKDMKWLDNAKSRMLRELQKEANALRREARIEARREVLQDPVYRAWVFLTTPIRPALKDKLKTKENFKSVDPTKDSLLTAIAKLGGIKDLEGELGIDREDIKKASSMTGLGVAAPISRKTGKSPDAMAEALWELGYLPEDEFGRYDVRSLEEKLQDSLGGQDHYSMAFDYDAYFGGIPLDIDEETGAMGGRLDLELVPLDYRENLRQKGMLRKKGDNPDFIAGPMGFTSGDEMVKKLADALPPRDAIEQRADQIMLERHSELATPEARNEAVNAALANDARTRMVVTEMNALERATRGRKGQVTPAQAAKRFAEQIVARKRIIDIVPRIFSASAAKAAKRADKARKAGNIAEAAVEKRNELVNLFATKSATDSKETVRKGLEYVKSLQKEARRKKIDIEYLDQIDQILEGYEFRRVSRRELERRESLQAWIAKQQDMGLDPDLPPEVVDRSLNVNFQTLTLEEFNGVIDSIKQIEHFGKLKNKLLTDAKKREVQTIVAEVQANIDANPRLKPIDDSTRSDIGTKIKQGFKAFTASHRKWASLIYQIDGFKYGTLFNSLVRTANERSNWEATKQAELTKRIGALMKNLPKKVEIGKGKYFDGIKRSLNREGRLSVALNWGNAGNRQRLLDGRGWTEDGVKQVLDTLTKEEWDFVQGVWDTFESLRPEIAEKERRVMGKEPEWIEPVPVETKFGALKGGYYPIVYDFRENSEVAKREAAEEAKRQLEGARSVAQTRRNFVKSRAKQVTNRPVVLTLDGMFRGLTDVVHDLAFHEWAIDANRLVDAISEPVRKAYGYDVMSQIVSAKNAIIAGENIVPGKWDFLIRHIRIGSMVAGLGFNIANALMQPLGLTQSIVRVGPQWMARGIGQYISNPVGLSKEAMEKSAFLRNRMRTRDREINDLRNKLRKTTELRQFIDDIMFAPMMLMQATVDIPTWKAGYDKAIADGADEATAISRADAEVIASQGGGQIKDLAEVQRGPEWKKLFTVFYGYFNTAYNLGAERVAKTSFRNPLEVASLAFDFLMIYAVPSVLAYALKEALSGDEDDEEELAKRLAVEQASYMMGLMVGVRELTPAVNLLLASALDTEAPFATFYQGPAGLRFVAEAQKLSQQSSQGEMDRAFLRSVVNVAGIALHLPSAQINRTIDGIIALDEGETENPAAVIGGAR